MTMNDDGPLTQAAKDMGAREVIERDRIEQAGQVSNESDAAAWDKTPTTKDILGTGKIEFHTELPTTEFKNLIGAEFLIREIKLIENWDGYFGTSTFALLLVQFRDGSKCTTLGGGVAILKQIRKLMNVRRFPVKVKLTEQPGQYGPYYLFE